MSWWARLDFMLWSQFELLFLPPPVSLPVCLRWSWGLWELRRAEERHLSPPELQGRLDRCNPENHPVSSSWGGWTEWSPASLAGSTKDIKILFKKKKKKQSLYSLRGGVLTFTLAVVVRGMWPVALAYSLFSCATWIPTRAEKAVARWRRNRVFWGGIFNSRARVSELKRGSRICGGAKGRHLVATGF